MESSLRFRTKTSKLMSESFKGATQPMFTRTSKKAQFKKKYTSTQNRPLGKKEGQKNGQTTIGGQKKNGNNGNK